MKKLREVSFLLFLFVFLSACSSAGQDPNFIYTVVAGTQTAAVYQTQMAELLFTSTPTQGTLRPTMTLQPTATTYIFVPSPSHTPIPSPSPTRTPRIRTEWPNWKTGEVISMPKGSGENIGTNKKFSDLTGLMVMVVRKNGVKLRPIPSKAIGGPIEVKGSAFTLTGVMNLNDDFGWVFAQVIAADGKTYWVGGSGDIQPNEVFIFYYPKLTPSPTISITPFSTPLLFRTPTP